MNKKNIIIGSIIAVLAILLITSFLWNRDVRNKLRIAQHNVETALDSIRYLKDANGNLYAEKKSFIATISELKELNTEMYENIQSLQKKLQKKILAGSDIGVVVVDTIYQDKIIEYTLDSLVNIPFSDRPSMPTASFAYIGTISVYNNSHTTWTFRSKSISQKTIRSSLAVRTKM